ncbi:hypothetical protein NQ318_011035 [Aromia moschata]|uniref:GH18 domain-containing protein n=1 Tax=Aromia moschata TaxID=1265417 RepID=A0AAV8YS97_9CUCU|nr:hypothetical protein NQ318_011035 [Aromia moschata]
MGTITFSVVLLALAAVAVAQKRVVCNYETKSHLREGQGKFDINSLEPALQYCTHLIYGYAAIKEDTLKLVPLNEQFDVIKDNYRHVTDLKRRYPKLKVLLSVGGNEDISGEGDEKNTKYREIVSAFWSSVKKTFAGETVVDENAAEHREQFTSLVKELKSVFRPDNLLISLTVLPNVNSTVYYDARALAPHLDFIVLHAFDFYTPQRNKKLADFPSPLYELIDRRSDENIDAWVKYWLNNGTPANKIVVGIPTYGRTWKLESDTPVDNIPIPDLDGPGDPGPQTKEAGLLSYPEICTKLGTGLGVKGSSTFKKVPDSTKRRGPYAYHLPTEDEENGIWIGYEDPESAANKAAYVKNKALGGIAIDDLTLDDFRGVCGQSKYAILKAAATAL